MFKTMNEDFLVFLDRRMPRLPRIPIDIITTRIALGGRDKLCCSMRTGRLTGDGKLNRVGFYWREWINMLSTDGWTGNAQIWMRFLCIGLFLF